MRQPSPAGIPIQKYLLRVYWLGVVPLLLLAAGLAFNNALSIREEQDAIAQRITANFAGAVVQEIQTTVQALQVIAQSPHLEDQAEWPLLHQETTHLQSSLGVPVAVLDASAPYTMRMSSLQPYGTPLGAPIRSEGFQALPAAVATLKPAVGDGTINPSNQRLYAAVVVPAVRDGRAIYAIASPLNIERIRAITERFALPAGWALVLRDGAGQKLALAGSEAPVQAEATGASSPFTVTAPVDRWQAVLYIPNSARLMPLLASGGALALLILASALAGALGSRLAGRHLAQALASITGGAEPGHLKIAEIQAAQAALNQSAAQARRNDARFRRLFQDAPIGMRLSDHDGKVLAQNAAFEEMFGYTLEDAPTIDKWVELAHPDTAYRERVSAMQAELTSNNDGSRKRARTRLIQVTDKQGKVHEVQAQGSFLPDGLLGSFIDVTDLRKAENDLRLWAEAFLHADLQLVIANPATDTILVANPAFARARGYTPEELAGQHVSLLLPPEHRDNMKTGLIERQHLTHFEYTGEHMRKDGTRFPVRIQSTVSRDESGRAIARLTYAIDLTAQKRAESEIQALHASLERRVKDRTEKLSQANQELDAFAHTLSHDLRAPLRAMNAYLHMLREDHGAQLPADGQQYLEQIEAATLRMNGMIEAILSLSSSTRHEMQMISVDLSELASRRLAELVRSHPDRKVVTEVEPGLVTLGDPRMLDSLMSNLIDNAWKYTGKTPEARIGFHARLHDDQKWFCVSDNGSGFDARHASKLFQPFQRMHRESDFPGMGIGLATVHRIVKRHHGAIVAESTPGQGASFCFTLATPSEGDMPEQSPDT